LQIRREYVAANRTNVIQLTILVLNYNFFHLTFRKTWFSFFDGFAALSVNLLDHSNFACFYWKSYYILAVLSELVKYPLHKNEAKNYAKRTVPVASTE
jgi:hypothetical protein